MAKRIFSNIAPAFQLDITSNNLVGDVFTRVDVGADDTYESMEDFFGSSGSREEHLMRILQASGVDVTSPLQAVIKMQTTPSAEFEQMCLKGWRTMLPDLAAKINLVWKKATNTLPADAHQDIDGFFAKMLARTSASAPADKVELTAN